MPFLKFLLLFLVLFLFPGTARAFCFEEAGMTYGVSPRLLWAIAKCESNFNPRAVGKNKNGSVDIGVMQINSIWRKDLGPTWNYLFDPCTNVKTGAWVLSQCVQKYGNSWKAVGCYHSQTPHLSEAYANRVAKILMRAPK